MTTKKATLKAVKPSTEKKAAATLEIDGKVYSLACDFNTLADHEEATGTNLLHAIPALALNVLTASQLRGLLYASLQKNHPHVPATKDKPETGVSLLRAGEMISLKTLRAVYDAIAKLDLVSSIPGVK